jgi:hypothetical protein
MPFDNDVNPVDMTQFAPGRRIENRHPVTLPSGRIREFYEIIETRLEPPLDYITRREFGIRPGHDCGCQPLGFWDISECCNPKCLSVTCKVHSATCFICGRVYCSGCVSLVWGYYFITSLCHSCEKELSTPELIKKLNKLVWR